MASVPFAVPILDAGENIRERIAVTTPFDKLSGGVLSDGVNFTYFWDIGLDYLTQSMQAVRGAYIYNPTNVSLTIKVLDTQQNILVPSNSIFYLPIFTSFPTTISLSMPITVVGIPIVILTNFELPTVLQG